MLIIGCDFHTRYQQIAMMDEATGELVERAGGEPLVEVVSEAPHNTSATAPSLSLGCRTVRRSRERCAALSRSSEPRTGTPLSHIDPARAVGFAGAPRSVCEHGTPLNLQLSTISNPVARPGNNLPQNRAR